MISSECMANAFGFFLFDLGLESSISIKRVSEQINYKVALAHDKNFLNFFIF